MAVCPWLQASLPLAWPTIVSRSWCLIQLFDHSFKLSPSRCVTIHPFLPLIVLTIQFKQGLVRCISSLLVHLPMIFLLNCIIQQNKPT
jgi:hypothetical protein